MTTSTASVANEGRDRRTPHRLLRGLLVAGALVPLAMLVPVASGVAAAKGSPVVKTAKRGSLGTVLVTSSGKALYKYGADRPNDPTCKGSCAAIWPPLLVSGSDKSPAGVSGLGSVKVAGGKRQVTYHKAPLYLFASDSGTSVKGQNVGGFTVIHPSKSANAASSTSTTSGGYGY